MANKKLTIVIPVKNGMETLPACLESIYKQTAIELAEVILVDSGSIDGSIDIAKKYNGIIIHSIDPKTFNHGGTRQDSLKEVTTSLVLFTVQDVVFPNDHVIESMLKHLEDSRNSAVCAKQVVPQRKEYNPINWYQPQSEPVAQEMTLSEDEKRQPNIIFKKCHWDNVCALYRKADLLEVPFQRVLFGEDMLWARDAMMAGKKLIFDERIIVFHYHHETYRDRYKRAMLVHFFEFEHFRVIRKESYGLWHNYLLPALQILKRGCSPKWIIYNWKLEWASMMVHYKMTKSLKDMRELTKRKMLNEMGLNMPIGRRSV